MEDVSAAVAVGPQFLAAAAAARVLAGLRTKDESELLVSELQLSRALVVQGSGDDPYIASWGYIFAGVATAGLIILLITSVTKCVTNYFVPNKSEDAGEVEAEKEALLAKECSD
mmetsp:Transcript_31691/g.67376  ORF Transcript_31691/g.67376 Transcript_31691/m.67376 type:complete len:114 (+) Transcript_31691:180-521(+)